MSVNEPLYNFARAFADQGTKNIIPDSNNEASGLASLINGFPAKFPCLMCLMSWVR